MEEEEKKENEQTTSAEQIDFQFNAVWIMIIRRKRKNSLTWIRFFIIYCSLQNKSINSHSRSICGCFCCNIITFWFFFRSFAWFETTQNWIWFTFNSNDIRSSIESILYSIPKMSVFQQWTNKTENYVWYRTVYFIFLSTEIE